LEERNAHKLAGALAHEIGALWGFEHPLNLEIEKRVFVQWQKDKTIVAKEELKELINAQLGREPTDTHKEQDKPLQQAEADEPFDPIKNPIEYQLVHEVPFLELFGVSTYDVWLSQYGSNQKAIDYVVARAQDVVTYYGGSVSAYITALNTVEDLSYALNNASTEVRNLFAEVYKVSVQPLTWQTEDYMAVLFGIVGSPDWKGVSNYISLMEAVTIFNEKWSASDKKTDINNLILKPIYGIDLSDDIQPQDLTSFGNSTAPNYNVLYKQDGTLKNETELQGTVDFFAAITIYNTDWSNSTKKTEIDTLIHPIYGLKLSDGLQIEDITSFGNSTAPNYNVLYKQD
ncbi:MAG: hypothetical protein AAB267_03630, partial [Candidatus Desantisbacteria bacterium]